MLILVPTTNETSIDVGSPVGGTGTLSISDTDLAALTDGFQYNPDRLRFGLRPHHGRRIERFLGSCSALCG
jgi:hypothetical protein